MIYVSTKFYEFKVKIKNKGWHDFLNKSIKSEWKSECHRAIMIFL